MRRVRRRAAGFAVFVVDVVIEEENFDFLGALGEQLDVDFGVPSRRAVEHAARQVGAKLVQQAHHLDRGAAHLQQAFGLFLVLVKCLPGAQFGFDLGVVGKRIRVRGAKLARRLALGETEIADAILGHHARRRSGNLAPQVSGSGGGHAESHGRESG